MALEPTQLPIQWVPGALSLGVKQLGCEGDHSPPSSAEVKECMELYLHFPDIPSWHGAQLQIKKKKKAQEQLYLLPLLSLLMVCTLRNLSSKAAITYRVIICLLPFLKQETMLFLFNEKLCQHNNTDREKL
jgi:hypothetical protein